MGSSKRYFHSSVPPRVLTSMTPLLKPPYSAEKGLESTRMDSTAAAGRRRAGCPVTGSAMLALLTSALVWLAWPPLTWMRPSGPRTTLGRRGRASWKSLLRRTTDFRVLVVSVGLAGMLEVTSTPLEGVVTVTDSVRFSGVSWRSSWLGFSEFRVMRLVRVSKPARVTVISHSPGRTPTKRYWPRSLEMVETFSLVERLSRVILALGQTVWT